MRLRIVLALGLAACRAPPVIGPGSAIPESAIPLPVSVAPVVDAWIASYGSSWGETWSFSGIVVVAHGDEVALVREAHPHGEERTLTSSLRIGSLTKTLTAQATWRLIDDGQVALDDPALKWVPALGPIGEGVTVEQLLAQTSGLGDYTEASDFAAQRDRATTVPALIHAIAGLPPSAPPGTAYRYSNSNYVVLGAVIEAATTLSYGEAMRRLVFDPAQLGDTEYTSNSSEDRGWTTQGDALRPAAKVHDSQAFSAGGLRSTAVDLVRWRARGLTGFSEEARARMTTPHTGGYAHGVFVGESDGVTAMGHDGALDGAFCAMRWFAGEPWTIFVFSDANPTAPAELVDAIDAALHGRTLPLREERALGTDARNITELVGSWSVVPDATGAMFVGSPFEHLRLEARDSMLVMTRAGQPATYFHPAAEPGVWFIKGAPGVELRFEDRRVVIQQGGVHVAFAPDTRNGADPSRDFDDTGDGVQGPS